MLSTVAIRVELAPDGLIQLAGPAGRYSTSPLERRPRGALYADTSARPSVYQLGKPTDSVRRRPYACGVVASPIALSPEFKATAAVERDALMQRYDECLARSEQHAALADEAAREAERYAKTIRELGEILEIEDQLSIVPLSAELRGERLRDIAADVLWRHFRAGDVVHYKQWFDLVVADGYRIGGKNPAATFLTQVARVDSVERVGRRSGLYKLVAA